MMKRRLCGKKVFLVLDDVDHIDQLEALASGPTWFKPGSRIIVTTRDKQVLVAHQVHLIRDINLLSDNESICLLSRYAFGRKNPLQGYEELSGKVVSYAAGLLLTVKVLGSFLCGKDRVEWVDAIERLEKIPLKETMKKLESSYMSLEDKYKEIFQDIACILKVLEQRSLITLISSEYEYDDEVLVGMHDHTEEMGKNIVRREHPDDPNKHSRLWIKEEIEDILDNDMVWGAQEDAILNGVRCIKDFDKDVDVSLVMKLRGGQMIQYSASLIAPSTIAVTPPVITEVEITLAQTLAELKSEKPKVVIQEPVHSTVTTAPLTIPKAKGITFRDAGETTTRTPTSVSSLSIKDKGKAKMIEPEVPLNKKDQIMLDEELARRLDAEEQEAARLERENVELHEEANLAKIEDWDNVQAMMDADYELCKRLQEQEQGELTIEEKSKLFIKLMNERKRHFAKLRAEEKRRKPLTKGQIRNQMCTYLKNIGGFTHNQLKNKSYEEIKKAFDKTMGWINNFKPMDSEEVKSSEKKVEGSRKKSISKKRAGNDQKQESSKRQRMEDDKETDEHEEVDEDDKAEMKKHMEIVQDDEEIAIDVIPLATKPPMIVEYKIVKE
ncbi:Toll/interleukin-1 receptor domain-containing protein [Tanacetum coccineum]